MGEHTEISWTDHTMNLWWGCTRIDPACEHCYAEAWAKRTGTTRWGPTEPRRTFGAAHWGEPLKWNRKAEKAGERRRVFCGSMHDWADKDAPRGQLEKLWPLIRSTPMLDWLLLTKRTDRIEALLPDDWGTGYPNAWLGSTVGDRKGLWRADALRSIPARVRFLSVEPLLEDLGDISAFLPGIHWVIVGGESGGRPRPMEIAWARSIRHQVRWSGAAFFMKQLGGHPDKRDRLEDLPEDLRIRDFPLDRYGVPMCHALRVP